MMLRTQKLLIARLTLVAVLLGTSTLAIAATNEPTAQADLGEATFQRICAACHTTLVSRASPTSDKAPNPIEMRALPREMLRQLPPEAVLTALTSGKMQVQGSMLNDAEIGRASCRERVFALV